PRTGGQRGLSSLLPLAGEGGATAPDEGRGRTCGAAALTRLGRRPSHPLPLAGEGKERPHVMLRRANPSGATRIVLQELPREAASARLRFGAGSPAFW